MMKRQYTIYNICVLLALLFLGGGWNMAMGQYENYTVELNRVKLPSYAVGESEEIRYVIPNEDYQIQLQRSGLRDNLNGYIRWYNETDKATHDGNTTNLFNTHDRSLNKYANGFFWYGTSNAPSGTITYNSSDPSGTIVCEASSIQNYYANDYGRLEIGSTVGVRRRYKIRDATTRAAALATVRTNAIDAGWSANPEDMDASEINAIKAAFFERNEIHTPMKAGTSYRLAEVLDNYVIKDKSDNLQYPTHVRWRIYDSNGKLHTGGTLKYLDEYKVVQNDENVTHRVTRDFSISKGYATLYEGIYTLSETDISGDLNPSNIIAYYHNYDQSKENEQQMFYLTAEVAYGAEYNNGSPSSVWYPVTFLTVYLEPNSEPTIAKDLKEERTDDYLEDNYSYLGGVTFDSNNKNEPSKAEENYPTDEDLKSILEANSYYAYAAPGMYGKRRANNRFVGSGEYGLYKTLGVSKGVSKVSPQNQTEGGIYYANWAMETYQVQVHDRLYEKTKGAQNGYFLYVDAADEAGVITSISLGKEALCPNTRIIVTAWVCNLKTTDENVADGSVNADIGFILKGKLNDEETVLTTFYSGEIANNPTEGKSFTEEAKWQQVYFSFDYHSNVEYEDYVLELTNNCRNTQGADYAVDQLSFYRSFPNIEVERLNDCDASKLKVQTDLSLLYTNVGWTENQPVGDMDAVMSDFSTRKYRYGLSNVEDSETSYLGNIYFAFMEGFDENNDNQTEGTGDGQYHWVNINKHLDETELPAAAYSARAIVSTHEDAIPTDSVTASRLEYVLNLRAILDFNADVYAMKNDVTDDGDGNLTVTTGDGSSFTIPKVTAEGLSYITMSSITEQRVNELASKVNGEWNMTEEEITEYYTAIEELYAQLGIPRIRCSWLDAESGAGTIRLSTIDVNSTDLKCAGETIYHDDGTQTTATGEYHVMIFTAAEVAGKAQVNPHWRCALVSPFTVRGVVTINIDTNTDYTTALCVGSQHRIVATLDAYNDDGDLIDLEAVYIFDWYLGPLNKESAAYEEGMDTYTDKIIETTTNRTLTLQEAIREYRDSNNDYMGEIGITNLNNWTTGDANIRKALISLIQEGKLMTGTPGGEEGFTMYVDEEEIVAMPYIPDPPQTNIHYCPDVTSVDFEFEDVEAPVLYPGYNNVPDGVKEEIAYLRLGLRHISTAQNRVTMTVPIRTNVEMATNAGASYLGLGEKNVVITWLNPNTNNLEDVGMATSMRADKTKQGSLEFRLTPEAAEHFHEGGTYALRIPYVQYSSSNSILGNQCDGLAYLYIKIVPEYLTWQGNNESQVNVWYDDENWNQSTKLDLYFDGYETTPNADANGDDEDLTDAFSPLYFTKITIPADKPELSLSDPTTPLASEFLIQYDMAIDTVENVADGEVPLTVNPYYINKVDQIYFKPNASLYRQDYLTYKKAWVDFEMKANTPYWMSAPLQDVYAGDMYAPSSNGRQETEVFKDITYVGEHEGGTTNDRWKPAFYQKAWDKAISYVTEDGYTHGTSVPVNVAAVKSNWSIEYNDVWVPYSLGKGFYSRVEEVNNTVGEDGTAVAQVRLPKADTKYSYETKALNNPNGQDVKRTNNGQMADEKEIIITLSDSDDNNEEVDGDGKHFLLGNPYMGYLKMTGTYGFLTENDDVLADTKFWTLDRNTGSIVVGTPDVTDWDKANGAHIITDASGDYYVAPMTAFFVELKDDATSKEITFSTSMIAQKPTTTDKVYTKSYSATNPTLTITAERGETKSVAKLVTSDKADNGYEASEDAVVLLDSELDAPMVYTVSGSRAAQVNAMKEISNVGLGIYNENDDEATVTISGLSQMASPLYLYDAQTRKSVELEGDSYTMQITGDSHGRYYLRNSAMADELENTISIYSAQRGQVIVSALQPVREIKVFNVSGALVRQFSVNTTQYTFPIQSGLYIIYASDGEQEHTEKVIVR